jgi:hypothetical protein
LTLILGVGIIFLRLGTLWMDYLDWLSCSYGRLFLIDIIFISILSSDCQSHNTEYLMAYTTAISFKHASLLPFQHPSESSQLSISDGFIRSLHGIYNNSWMEKSLDFDYIFKYILIGDSSVGKSTILSMFINNSYLADSNPTMGV